MPYFYDNFDKNGQKQNVNKEPKSKMNRLLLVLSIKM